MARVFGALLIGFAGFVTVAYGAFVGLPWAMRVASDQGTTWGYAALAAVFVVCTAIAVALWRLQDRLSGGAARRHAGAPDVLYCQRCGAPARLTDQFCAACGSTSLAVRRPRATTG